MTTICPISHTSKAINKLHLAMALSFNTSNSLYTLWLVPLELLESLKDAAHTFFSLPPEKKAVYCTGVSPSPKYGKIWD